MLLALSAHLIPSTYAQMHTVSTLAGNGSAGFADGSGSMVSFNNPNGIAFDYFGNLYVADSYNNAIRMINSNGYVSTLAGGFPGFADGYGSNARFNNPNGIAFDSLGNFYVADSSNHAIRKINSTGYVSTLAGNGAPGFIDGPASYASFKFPNSVAVDCFGSVYVADFSNYAIRMINSSGYVSTLAGTGSPGFIDGPGTNASFNNPTFVEVDSFGILYVVDNANHAIRMLYSLFQVILVFNNAGKAGSQFFISVENFHESYVFSVHLNFSSISIHASNCSRVMPLQSLFQLNMILLW